MERHWQGQTGTEPNDRYDLLTPPSACPGCGTQIRAWQNIPLISFLLLRGQCANCGERISLRYPLVELLGALIALFAVFVAGDWLELVAILVFSYSLLALFFIDLEKYLLPDIITLPLLWAGLLFNISANFAPLDDAVIGAAAGYGSLWLMFQLFRLLTGKEGLGYGDFKLVAAIGAWLGWQVLPLVILLGSFSGAIIGGVYLALSRHGRDHPIPFGPFLALAGWIAMFWGELLINEYLQFAGFRTRF